MDTGIEAPDGAAAIDVERFRLRAFVEGLAGSEEVEVRDAPVALADIAVALEGNPRAVWFRKAGSEEAELVGNVAGSRTRLARAFEVAPETLLPEVLRRLRNHPTIVEIPQSAAPAQQVVLTSDEVDVTRLPVHLQHGEDGAPYISASIDYAIDPRTGWTNVGCRRLMLRGRRETGVDLVSPSDLRAIYEVAQARGEKLPVSFVVGCHPIDLVAATMRLPVDELGLVAALRDAFPGGSRSRCRRRAPHAAARPVARGRTHRRHGGLRPHLAPSAARHGSNSRCRKPRASKADAFHRLMRRLPTARNPSRH